MTDLEQAARDVLAAYQRFLDSDDLDGLRDALTELEAALPSRRESERTPRVDLGDDPDGDNS